jgi:hypothetical protein
MRRPTYRSFALMEEAFVVLETRQKTNEAYALAD